jgi:hypothetical protein
MRVQHSEGDDALVVGIPRFEFAHFARHHAFVARKPVGVGVARMAERSGVIRTMWARDVEILYALHRSAQCRESPYISYST